MTHFLTRKNKENKITIVREVIDSVFGTVKVALSAEDRLLYCLQDLCKLMGINMQNIIVLLGNNKLVHLDVIEKKKKTKKAFVDREGLNFCIRSSRDRNADYIGVWLKKVEKDYSFLFQNIKPKELSDVKFAKKVLNRLSELEKIVSVLELKIEEGLSLEEKKEHAVNADNGLWLCQNHHKLFDTNILNIVDGETQFNDYVDLFNLDYLNYITTNNKLENTVINNNFNYYLNKRINSY